MTQTETLPITVRIAVALQTLGQPVNYGRAGRGFSITYATLSGTVLVQVWHADPAMRVSLRDSAERLLAGMGYLVTRPAAYVLADGSKIRSTSLLVAA